MEKPKYGVSVKIELIKDGSIVDWVEHSHGCKDAAYCGIEVHNLSYGVLRSFEQIVKDEIEAQVELPWRQEVDER